jgi:hypothetical protein
MDGLKGKADEATEPAAAIVLRDLWANSGWQPTPAEQVPAIASC